ncbi:MAG: VOC family protein [Microbacteriaceae bacterium]
MPLVDHIGITVDDVASAIAQFDPVLTALGYVRHGEPGGEVSWDRENETEILIYPAREPGTGPHRHGRVGWQHLSFAVDSPTEVDRMHAIAVAAGWVIVREPKLYPRFNENYYASFVEDANGIRIEFRYRP